MKKNAKTKTAGSSRKAAKTPATAKESKAPRTRERDARLPAPGTTMTRTYKGKELKVAVLEDGFRFDGEQYRSLSALASRITGASAINGFLFFRLTGRATAAPKPEATKETERPVERAKARAPKRAAKVRRAGRDPQPSVPPESPSAPASAMEIVTA